MEAKRILSLGLAAFSIFLLVPKPAHAAGNPTTEIIELGRLLFFDKRLSADNTISCATCHDPKRGFTDNQPVSTGIKGQKGNRNAPTVINRIFGTIQFWDGRAASLEDQAKGPLTNPVEMGMTDHNAVVSKLKKIKFYAEQSRKIFGREINIDDVASAIASFERTVVSDDSKFDLFVGGDAKALNASEKNGLDLFSGKGRCAVCHSGPRFSDEDFHNIGVGMNGKNPDLGRFNVTHKDEDKGAFKTPALRDISSTAPYMHDGSLKTLKDVIEFYDTGGIPNPNLHPIIEKLELSKKEKADLESFLKALDGKRWRNITAPEKFPD